MTEFKINEKVFSCPVELTLNTIMGKWKALILWNVREEKKRYGELRKLLNGINHKMLTQQLRELEHDNLIERTVYDVIPPKVEYSLTEEGAKIVPILKMMQQWGLQFKVR